MLFVINGNLNQYLRPREIYQKKISRSDWLFKLYQGRGIQSDTNLNVLTGSDNVLIKGKHVSKCIKILWVLENCKKGP